MPRIIDDAQVENAARALLGAIDTGDGGTPEQHAVLQAFVASYWERPDLDLASLEPLDPAATAAAFPELRNATASASSWSSSRCAGIPRRPNRWPSSTGTRPRWARTARACSWRARS